MMGRIRRFRDGLETGIFVIIIIAVALLASWAVTCGIIYLITLCFGLEFRLLTATGIWLVFYLVRSLFTVNVNGR